MSRKRIFFFVFLPVMAGLCFCFAFLAFQEGAWKSLFLGGKNRPSAPSFRQGGTQSPCRAVPFPPPGPPRASLSRREKLDRLMNKPLDWVFKDIHGDVIDLYCFRGDKIVALHFWATWCPPCIKELPSLARLAERFADRIFVSALSAEEPAELANFISRSFPDLSPYLKIVSVSEELRSRYFPEDSLPVTYVFSTKGLLRFKKRGSADWSEKALVRRLFSLP